MRRSYWKRAVIAGLTLAVSIGLCACGNSGNKYENAALAKEHVYKFNEFKMPEIDGDDNSVQQATYRDGVVYLLLEVYHWNDEKYGGNADMRVISIKDDGSDVQMINLEIPEWRSEADGNDLPDATEPEDDTVEPEGDAAEPDGDTAEPEDNASDPEEAGIESEIDTGEIGIPIEEPIDDEYYDPGFYENSYYQNYNFSPDGRVYAIRHYYYENYVSEEYISTQKDYICCWNKDGSFAWESEMEGLQSEDEWLYVSSMYIADDGSVNMILTGDNCYKVSVDTQGNVSGKTALSEELQEILSNLGNLFVKPDGTMMMTYYDPEDWSKQFIVSYDPVKDILGEPGELPATLSWNGYGNMAAGINSDLVYTTSQGVFTYNIGDADSTEKLNFVNSDLYINYLNTMVELDENTFLGVFSESWGEDLKAGIFTYVDPEDIPDKAVIVLGGDYIRDELKRRAIEFNRSSDEYRIVLRDYDNYNSYEDYNAGITQLNNDIIAGNMPDILITSGLPMENYISKGLLADIGKLIKEDEELSQVEFVQNVFDAYSVKGKLYYIIPTFSVNTVIGKTSIVGDRTSWTMEDMKQLAATLQEGTVMFGEVTRDDFFRMMMEYCAGDFVDVATGKCDFDSQNFIAMMEYAKSLPEEFGEDYYSDEYWQNYWENYQSQYRENRTILCQTYIGRISDFNRVLNGMFGEDVSYIGFPTESGMGSYVMANLSYAISARSSNIDGAWEFMRYYLTDEYQSSDNLRWYLPVSMECFMKNANEALEKPYWLDEDGNKVEYDDTFYMNGESIPLDPMTQEQLDKLLEFIFSIDKCYYNNEDLMNIINEEMPSYFTGQKSAQEVAKVIQSRAQIYVNEK